MFKLIIKSISTQTIKYRNASSLNRLYSTSNNSGSNGSHFNMEKMSKKKYTPIDTPKLLSISSFFRYPEGGVNEYANLSKGTAFLVQTPKSGFIGKPNNSIYCISCAHITHPFQFPNLYKEEQYSWLYVLGESNIKAQLEYRDDETGKLLHSIPLKPPYYLHPLLDLVVFKVDEDDFKKSNIPYQASIIELEPYDFPKEGNPGRLFGYQLVNEKENIMKPMQIDFQFHFAESSERFFLSTESVSPMGVCGGPVVNIENEVIGMVEGLVQIDPTLIDKTPNPKKREFLRKTNNNTVFIPSQVLNNFISSIDSNIGFSP
ncbi:hypothetical protein DLAC_11714 [Tieghemostelium lacteum]|uniref:Trypsin-like serine protease n=1 Tax=Tieghemostelium lacteum TaxID=361077 RepID=A0A151ZBK9_TIELA|nr:hypothetical protein DLAC_11714 [Tieghemostelium lacteum]|eukprot:KYQ91315.1 hypothetical protein DLAC_11714 [Tieghemostelium lacteum]